MLTESRPSDVSDFPTELIHHLCRFGRLNHLEAEQLVREILAFYNESVASFIRRRHMELQRAGFANSEIYRLIAEELPDRRFVAESMSERQIRRTIYG